MTLLDIYDNLFLKSIFIETEGRYYLFVYLFMYIYIYIYIYVYIYIWMKIWIVVYHRDFAYKLNYFLQ